MILFPAGNRAMILIYFPGKSGLGTSVQQIVDGIDGLAYAQ